MEKTPCWMVLLVPSLSHVSGNPVKVSNPNTGGHSRPQCSVRNLAARFMVSPLLHESGVRINGNKGVQVVVKQYRKTPNSIQPLLHVGLKSPPSRNTYWMAV